MCFLYFSHDQQGCGWKRFAYLSVTPHNCGQTDTCQSIICPQLGAVKSSTALVYDNFYMFYMFIEIHLWCDIYRTHGSQAVLFHLPALFSDGFSKIDPSCSWKFKTLIAFLRMEWKYLIWKTEMNSLLSFGLFMDVSSLSFILKSK